LRQRSARNANKKAPPPEGSRAVARKAVREGLVAKGKEQPTHDAKDVGTAQAHFGLHEGLEASGLEAGTAQEVKSDLGIRFTGRKAGDGNLSPRDGQGDTCSSIGRKRRGSAAAKFIDRISFDGEEAATHISARDAS